VLYLPLFDPLIQILVPSTHLLLSCCSVDRIHGCCLFQQHRYRVLSRGQRGNQTQSRIMVALIYTIDHVVSTLLAIVYCTLVMLQWCNQSAHHRAASRYALLDHEHATSVTHDNNNDVVSTTTGVDDNGIVYDRTTSDGSQTHSRATSSNSHGRQRKPTRVGQMNRELMVGLLPAGLLLAMLAIDPIGIYGILSPVWLDMIYFNLSTTVYMGLGVILASTVRIHIVVVRSPVRISSFSSPSINFCCMNNRVSSMVAEYSIGH
jgi:hypothetical protein